MQAVPGSWNWNRDTMSTAEAEAEQWFVTWRVRPPYGDGKQTESDVMNFDAATAYVDTLFSELGEDADYADVECEIAKLASPFDPD